MGGQGVVAHVGKMDQQQQHQDQQQVQYQASRSCGSAAVVEDPSSKVLPKNNANAVYDVEHLATFSTTANHETTVAPPTTTTAAAATTTTSHSTASSTSDGANSSGSTTTTGSGSTNCGARSQNGYMFGKSDCIEQQEQPQRDQLVANGNTSRRQKPDAIAENPQVALERLFELEQLTGIWTQRMQIELDRQASELLIRDCETDQVVERFASSRVTKPEAFNQFNDIYNNILLFIIEKPTGQKVEQATKKKKKNQHQDKRRDAGELDNSKPIQQPVAPTEPANSEIHIFQCVSHDARQLVDDILAWKNAEACAEMKEDFQDTDRDTKLPLATSDAPSSAASRQHHDNLHADLGADKGGRKMITAGETDNKAQSSSTKSQSSSKQKHQQQVGTDGATSKPAITLASSCLSNHPVPIVNVNVKETVQVFNQIAALREKSSKPSSPTSRPLSSETSSRSPRNGSSPSAEPAQQQQQLYKQCSIRASLGTEHDGSGSSSSQQRYQPAVVPLERSSSNSDSAGSSSCSSGTVLPEPAIGTKQANERHPAAEAHEGKPTSRGYQQHSVAPARSHKSASSPPSEQVATNESYVSVLNHCFDDIEKFIIRLQQAMSAIRELQAKRKQISRRSAQLASAGTANDLLARGARSPQQQPALSTSDLALLNARASGPSEDDYFEILCKFKLAFNLLAKLKGCIHDPNAPELVHFLFTPLAIINEAARTAHPAVDPTLVGIPYLNQDAIELLSNCCTSKESDLWMSLGPNWTQTIEPLLLEGSRLPSSFQPIFSDGWAPVISELDLIGIVPPLDAPSEPDDSIVTQDQLPHETYLSSKPAARYLGLSAAEQAKYAHHAHQKQQQELKKNHQSTAVAMSNRYPDGHIYGKHAPVIDETIEAPIERSHYRAAGGGLVARAYAQGELQGGRGARRGRHGAPTGDSMLDGMLEEQFYSRSKHTGGYRAQHPQTDSHGFVGGPLDDYDDADLHEFYLDDLQQQQHNVRLPPGSRPSLGMTNNNNNNERHHSGSGNNNNNSKSNSHHHHHHHHLRQQVGGGGLRGDGRATSYSSNQVRGRSSSSSRQMASHDQHRSQQHQQQQQVALQLAPGKQQQSQRQQFSYAYAGYGQANHNHNQGAHSDQLDEAEQEAMLLDLGPAQTEWLLELQARSAMTVRVLFTREANNDKELSVRRGEVLEILDYSRKWWRARNIDSEVGHLPHTIVAVMCGYQTLDELLAANPDDQLGSGSGHDIKSQASSANYSSSRYDRSRDRDHYNGQWANYDAKPNDVLSNNPKNVGPFRYF